MDEVSKSGRTILFVSHNMNAVNSLCTRCIFLGKGKIVDIGKTEDIINQYLKGDNDKTNMRSWLTGAAVGDDAAQLLNARLINEQYETLEYTAIDECTSSRFSISPRIDSYPVERISKCEGLVGRDKEKPVTFAPSL